MAIGTGETRRYLVGRGFGDRFFLFCFGVGLVAAAEGVTEDPILLYCSTLGLCLCLCLYLYLCLCLCA
jgi:hypothetical protein